MFLAWLKKQRGRRDPVGELASDVLYDSRAPSEYEPLRAHLVSRGACVGAIDALEQAWLEYEEDTGRRP